LPDKYILIFYLLLKYLNKSYLLKGPGNLTDH
jgi:hypothetical protein